MLPGTLSLAFTVGPERPSARTEITIADALRLFIYQLLLSVSQVSEPRIVAHKRIKQKTIH
jgi:hypothetical protein